MIILETERLLIRDYLEDDLQKHYTLMSDEEVMYYLKDIQTFTEQQSANNLNLVIEDLKNDNRKFYFFKIFNKVTYEYIGEIGYTVDDFTYVGKLVGLGYFIHKQYWGNGYVSEALKEVMRFAFLENDVYRISTGCLAENIGSEKVMQNGGMIKEGYYKVVNRFKIKSKLSPKIGESFFLLFFMFS